jgi:hypothetical protein
MHLPMVLIVGTVSLGSVLAVARFMLAWAVDFS